MQFKSLSFGLVGLLSMGLVACAQPLDNRASDKANTGATTPWSPNAPAWFPAKYSPELETRDVRAVPNFASPHVRRAFVVGLGSNLITGANWVFEMWVKDSGRANLWRSEVSGSTNLHFANVLLPRVTTIFESANQWRGSAIFQMSGWVGNAELIIEFTAEVFASSAACYIQKMIKEPVATLGNIKIPVTSWKFATQDD